MAWNQELLHIVQTPSDRPATIHPTRSFAIAQVAIYDAVVSITRQDPPLMVVLQSAVERYQFDRMYRAWRDRNVAADAKNTVRRSAERYNTALLINR